MSWNIGFSRNLVLNLQKKLGLFHIVSQKKSLNFSITVSESQILSNLQDLNTKSLIFLYEGTLHNERR